MEYRIVEGDIADQRVDALVNAAGTSLRMGSGVAGALRRRGGSELNEAAMSEGPIDLGDVAVTDAFDLDAEYVVHAAAMPHHGDGKATEESIRSATRNALRRADELECESIVVPALGCGVAGYDLADGVRLIADEVDAFDPAHLSDVRLIGYGDDEYATMREALGANRHDDG